MEPRRKDDPPGFPRQGEVDSMFLDLLRGERVPRYGKASFRPNADVYFDNASRAVVVKLDLSGIDPGADRPGGRGERAAHQRHPLRHERIPTPSTSRWRSPTAASSGMVMLPPEVDAGRRPPTTATGSWRSCCPSGARSASKRIAINMKDECSPSDEDEQPTGRRAAGMTARRAQPAPVASA